MSSIIWQRRPALRDPAAVVAFDGWSDAGSAASEAVIHLVRTLGGVPAATIDGEDFVDFQVRRPVVSLHDGSTGAVEWPETRAWVAPTPWASRDVVAMLGVEPNMHWRSFLDLCTDLLSEVGVRRVVTLGAFGGQVPHTLPVPLIGAASDPSEIERRGLFASSYEGPTGIVGVLTRHLAERGFDVLGLWAAVPDYLANRVYTPGVEALLDAALEAIDVDLDLADLRREAADFRAKVDEAVRESTNLTEYVHTLETDGDEPDDPGEALVEEIERFLRDT